jgi:biotin carboxyl carrier protein
MKYLFHLDKKKYKIEIGSESTFHSETRIKIKRKYFNLMLGDYDENGIGSFFMDNRPYQIEIVKNTEGYPEGIFVNGEYYSAKLLKIDRLFYYKEKKFWKKKSGIVKSFIPGSISKVFFNLHDWVEEGQIVLIHAAMKMENEIRSPKSGIIKTMGVKEGDNILANHILFEVG